MPQRMLALAACCVALHAQGADRPASAAHARSLAATCASCHSSTSDSSIPSLDAMPQPSIAQAMRDFRAGKRAGTVMPQLARGYTDEQIDVIARWYSARSR